MRELNSVGINLCVGPDPRASLRDLHSGLGPTLGLIPDLVLPSRLVSSMYADDTVLYQSGNNADEAAHCLQANLNLCSH